MSVRPTVVAEENFGSSLVTLRDAQGRPSATIQILDHELSEVVETLLIRASQQSVMSEKLQQICNDVALEPMGSLGRRLEMLKARAENGR